MTADFPIVIYHNPDCGTSRNALAMIQAAGYAPQVVEYLKAGWTETLLRDLLAAMSARPRDLAGGFPEHRARAGWGRIFLAHAVRCPAAHAVPLAAPTHGLARRLDVTVVGFELERVGRHLPRHALGEHERGEHPQRHRGG